MIKILEILATEYTATPPTPIRAALIGDTTADLPAVGDISGYTLTQGSTCHVIQDSTLYMLNSTGAWIQQLQDITADTYTRAQVDAMITGVATDISDEETARISADAALQTALDGKATVAAIYGIGTSLVSGDDLNDYMTVGRYYAGASISASITNKPAVSSYGFEMTVENNSTSARVIQTITYNTSNALHIGKLYKRWYTSDGWSSWYTYAGTT